MRLGLRETLGASLSGTFEASINNGTLAGASLGSKDGLSEGQPLRLSLGPTDGILDGTALGSSDGEVEGDVLRLDGETLGPKDGAVDGPDEGTLRGLIDKLGPSLA